MRTNQEDIIVNSDNFVTTVDEKEKENYNYLKVLKPLKD